MNHNPLRLAGFALLAGSLSAPAFSQTPIRITADLTDAPRKLYHAEIDLPVKPGPAAFTTPEWIPGNHRPTGPVDDITGVVFTANGKTLPWRRDDADLYQFHVDVPLRRHHAARRTSTASCSGVSPTSSPCSSGRSSCSTPRTFPFANIPIQPSVTVPKGWGIGTALTARRRLRSQREGWRHH